ncbi:MAG: hypothetical protein ACJ72A_06230 [Nocardioidaceae bacterium]
MSHWDRLSRPASGAVESYLGRFLLFAASLMIVTLIFANTSNGPPGWDAADWQAAATVVTAMVALLAVVLAVYHLRDARELRWEQAQPYVAAYLEPDATDPEIVSLVIRNYGRTAASNLSIHIEPPPAKSEGVGGGPLVYPDAMPSLVPGQEWRTFWDLSPFRFSDQDVATRHVVTLRFDDARSIGHTDVSVLDWGLFTTGPRWIGRNSIDSIGKDVKSMDIHLARIAYALEGGVGRHPSDDVMGLLEREDATRPPEE